MSYDTRSRAAIQDARVEVSETAVARESRQILAAEAVTFPLLVGVVHFLIVQVTASLAWKFGNHNISSEPVYLKDPAPVGGLFGALVEPMRLWDGLWYKGIADFGYDIMPNANPAFWPLYPWLMAAGSAITGLATETVGWLISNLAFVVALGLLYQLVMIDFDRRVARRTLLALALFPTSLFFSAVYTESLFLALAVGALLAARTRSWALAGIVGLLAALTRSQGIMLLFPFAVLFIQQYGWNPRAWFPNGLFAALPIGGPLIFMAHLRSQDIDALAFVDVQGQWYRFSAMPWETMRCATVGCVGPADHEYIPANYPIEGADWGWLRALFENFRWSYVTSVDFRDWMARSDTLELICFVLFVALGLIGLKALPLYYSAYLWPPLLVPLFSPSAVHPLMSIPRFGIVLFPVFVVLALIFHRKREAIPAAVLSTILLVLFTIQFSTWFWVS